MQELGRAIKQLQTQNHRRLDTGLQKIGLTLAQWDALRAIETYPGVSAHLLAEQTFQTDQSFGTLATRLITKGLVDRRQGVGRALEHRLTSEGRALLTKGSEVARQVLDKTFAHLSVEERNELLRLVKKVIERSAPPNQERADHQPLPSS